MDRIDAQLMFWKNERLEEPRSEVRNGRIELGREVQLWNRRKVTRGKTADAADHGADASGLLKRRQRGDAEAPTQCPVVVHRADAAGLRADASVAMMISTFYLVLSGFYPFALVL